MQTIINCLILCYFHNHILINTFWKDLQGPINQNESWFGVKQIKDIIKKSRGPTYLEGKPWSEDLYDKFKPVATHCHWTLKTCEQYPEKKWRSSRNNIKKHFINNHSECHNSSRCKTDNN